MRVGGGQQAVDDRGARSVQGRARLQIGGRACWEERTRNIQSMAVTPEVFQLETSALKFFKSLKSSLMSVMAETSHSAMGPYVAMAAVGFAL